MRKFHRYTALMLAGLMGASLLLSACDRSDPSLCAKTRRKHAARFRVIRSEWSLFLLLKGIGIFVILGGG